MSQPRPRVVIIGASIGGLSLAIALKRQLGFENFTIFEKASSVGGTWRVCYLPVLFVANDPLSSRRIISILYVPNSRETHQCSRFSHRQGCSSDVPIHFYSLSTDLKSDWTCSHPFQPEIESYWQDLSHRYSLQSHIYLNTKVVKAVWDITSHVYRIITEDTKTGEHRTTHAEVLVSAVGPLNIPRYPEISGLSGFQGPLFHSARWEKEVDLSGKRVAVIGNGASATQLIPIISKTPGIQVTQFCRTPSWIMPPIRKWYSTWTIRAFKYMPLVQRCLRFLQYLQTDFYYFTIFKYSITRRIVSKALTEYMRHAAPAKYHAQLTPSYPLGCKRVIFDTDYFSTLHQENMTLNWDGITSIAENAIITRKGDNLPFDVIILATGYSADKYPLIVQGVEGQTIQEHYDGQGGPTAYLGTSIPGFPNFYTICGPNTATGHTSVIFTEEVQVNYVTQLIKPILEQQLSVINVKASATEAYNAKLQARLSHSVFVQCSSWYRVGGIGKVNSIFPGSGALFWWWLRRPVWSHYDVVQCDRP